MNLSIDWSRRGRRTRLEAALDARAVVGSLSSFPSPRRAAGLALRAAVVNLLKETGPINFHRLHEMLEERHPGLVRSAAPEAQHFDGRAGAQGDEGQESWRGIRGRQEGRVGLARDGAGRDAPRAAARHAAAAQGGAWAPQPALQVLLPNEAQGLASGTDSCARWRRHRHIIALVVHLGTTPAAGLVCLCRFIRSCRSSEIKMSSKRPKKITTV